MTTVFYSANKCLASVCGVKQNFGGNQRLIKDASMQLTDGVRLPYGAEQDGDGFWCARAQIRRGVAAFGEGTTREAALDDLRTALDLL